jgi:phage gp36-like protein
MAYVTDADIQARLGNAAYVQLTDDAGSGSADAAKVAEARLGAEAEVDSYLATRYRVPVDVSGEANLQALLKSVVLDLVTYRLHGRRPPIPEDLVRRRSEAIEWLTRVAAGLVQLPSVSVLPAGEGLGTLVDVAGPQRIMTRSMLDDV